MNRLLLAAITLLPLVLAGCTSAQRQYERGMELEVQGNFAEAAQYYANAIRRDADLNRMLPGRLRESGRQAIEAYVVEAQALHQSDRSADAADLYMDADALVALGASVGVEIPTLRRYAENRRETFDAAIESLLEQGRQEHDVGEYRAAVRHLERGERYEPSPEQLHELRDEATATRLSWATWLFDTGQFRRAYDVAEVGLAFPSRHSGQLRDLQMLALEAGTLRLAALPPQRLGGDLRDLPRHFTQDLTLLLDDEYWGYPPLFLETTDPSDVHRLTRRLRGSDALVGNPRLAAGLGRDLYADYILAAGIDRFVRTTREERRTEQTVRLRRRGAGSTTYTEIRTPTTFRGGVQFEVVDVATRLVVCSARIERTTSGTVVTGEYDGDIRELRLSREQEELFTASGFIAQERRLHDRLAHELADALSARVYACVTARVP